MQMLEERKVHLVEEARQICQQRVKLLGQQQFDLAVKTASVEDALRKAEGAVAEQARSPVIGEYAKMHMHALAICMSLYYTHIRSVTHPTTTGHYHNHSLTLTPPLIAMYFVGTV